MAICMVASVPTDAEVRGTQTVNGGSKSAWRKSRRVAAATIQEEVSKHR